MKTLNELLGKTDEKKIFIEKSISILDQAKQIVIFGAGIGGEQLYELLKENNLSQKIVCFADNNEMKIGLKYKNFEVVKASELHQLYPNALVAIASTAFNVIRSQLLEYGFTTSQIHYFQLARLDSGQSDCEYIWKNIQKYQESYQLLKDDKSREIFVNLLNYRISKNPSYLDKMSQWIDEEAGQYFDYVLVDDIRDKYFIDCGSYTGDTLECYVKRFPNNKKCICFEADEAIHKILNDKVEENKWEKVRTYNIAVWDKKESLLLDISSSQNGGSSVSKSGNQKIEADAIDNVLQNEEVGFIKMDIEGAELKALQGAKKTIIEQCPILAICVYHCIEDFYAIPLFIKSLNNNYKFYFRQYRYGQSETVCYAIPK